MPLPPEVDQRIRARLEKLADEGASLGDQISKFSWDGLTPPLKRKFSQYKTSCISLLSLLSGLQHINEITSQVIKLKSYEVQQLAGIMWGIKDDYEAGMLQDLAQMVEANVTGDYLTQAEQLLQEGKPGQHDHVPAAVLAGAILENSLRKLCGRQIPPITTINQNKNPRQ